jgi:hypothetical protein
VAFIALVCVGGSGFGTISLSLVLALVAAASVLENTVVNTKAKAATPKMIDPKVQARLLFRVFRIV